jgi:hypothetical protein
LVLLLAAGAEPLPAPAELLVVTTGADAAAPPLNMLLTRARFEARLL